MGIPEAVSGDIHALDLDELKPVLQRAGIKRLDTAARYANGESEKRLGQARYGQSFTIDTKIYTDMNAAGTLTPEAITKSLTNSLAVLQVDRVATLYVHAPDHETPVAVQARAFDAHFREGKFEALGVSNIPVSMVEEWLDIAEQENLVKPSVYQGQYNLVCRGYEETLFPLLRKHGIRFAAYSPLAGGFLLGHLRPDRVQGGSRFKMKTPYTNWYDQPRMHEGMDVMRKISEKTGIALDELAIRWLFHHSILNDRDRVILGASKSSHIEKNAEQIQKGPLELWVAEELNGIWSVVREDAMRLLEY